MTSGRDRLSVLAEDRLRELGARRAPVTTADVEIKLAVREVTDAGVTTKTYRGGMKPTWR